MNFFTISDTDLAETFIYGILEKMESFFLEELLAGEVESVQQECELSLDMDAIIFYTSGTTGLPKGVVHTHETVSNILPGPKDLRAFLWMQRVFPVLLQE